MITEHKVSPLFDTLENCAEKDKELKIQRGLYLHQIAALEKANARKNLVVTTGTAVLTEYIYEKLMHKPVTIKDCSALVTGLLLALNLPPTLPLWMGALGSVFAILVVKQLFGGLGQNFMNPALAARCFLLISFTGKMTYFVYDGVTGPTPLADLKAAARAFEEILGGEDVTAVAEADVAFHDVIYMATDNQRLISLLNNLREQMYRYRVEYLKKKECHKQLYGNIRRSSVRSKQGRSTWRQRSRNSISTIRWRR